MPRKIVRPITLFIYTLLLMKFADVKNDIAFRKIFGNENRTETLISFLNAVLGFEGKDRIVSVTILNPYQLPALKGGKVSILDVRATDQKSSNLSSRCK